MNTQILEKIGLTKTEIKIYLALLSLGQSTTTGIIREAQIHASKVYEYLDKLVQKGLVSYVIKSNRKYFSASNPESLKELLKEKERKIKEQEKEIDEIMPSLKQLMKKEEKINAEIYEGLKGIKSVSEKIISTLKKGETQYIIGAPRIGNEKLEGFLIDWHKRRIKKGIRCKYIYNSDVRDYGKVREKMPLTDVRYFSKNIGSSPVWIEIFGDYTVIGHIKGSQSILFVIRDREIAKRYLDYFKIIWEKTEK